MTVTPGELATKLPIFPVLDELRACLCNALGDTVPCFCGLLVGNEIPSEYVGDCDDCGAAYVRVATAFSSTQDFPSPDAGYAPTVMLAYSVFVGVLRCSALGDESPPDPEVVEEEALQALADMAAIDKAIRCCFAGKFPDVGWALGFFQPLPNEGGVRGGEWGLTIQQVL